MHRSAFVLAVTVLCAAACGDDDDGGDDVGGIDAAPSTPDAASGDTPSTNPNAPVALTPGQTFSATVATNGVHYFSFTPTAAGRFTVSLTGPAGIEVNWCDDSTAQGCLCAKQNNFSTCCQTMQGTSCNFTMEKAANTPLDANVTIYPQVYVFGPGGAYTLMISQAL